MGERGNRVARAARPVLLHTLIIGLKNVNVNEAWKVFGALFDSSRYFSLPLSPFLFLA